jgi:hypothetical protein
MAFIGNQPFTAAFLTDTFSGTGSQTAFTMTVAPANTSSIIVAVTGVLQDPSTYSVSGTTLTFSTAPPSGTSNISVRYLGIPASGVTTTAYRTVTEFTATSGQTSFSTPSYTVGYIDVYRNGVMLGTTDFTATTGTTVVLASGATTGDLIRTESFYVSSVLNAIPATAGSVSTSYLVDGSVTQAKLSTNVAGNGPAFSAYANTTQAISQSTFTKVTFGTELFDTNNNFSSSTFTPTVAGYYQLNASINFGGGSASSYSIVSFYKNGSEAARSFAVNATQVYSAPACWLAYFNGTTDYVEVYAYTGQTSVSLYGTSGGAFTYFQGYLVRSA